MKKLKYYMIEFKNEEINNFIAYNLYYNHNETVIHATGHFNIYGAENTQSEVTFPLHNIFCITKVFKRNNTQTEENK